MGLELAQEGRIARNADLMIVQTKEDVGADLIESQWSHGLLLIQGLPVGKNWGMRRIKRYLEH